VLWAEAEETASSELPAARRQKRRLDFGFIVLVLLDCGLEIGRGKVYGRTSHVLTVKISYGMAYFSSIQFAKYSGTIYAAYGEGREEKCRTGSRRKMQRMDTDDFKGSPTADGHRSR
jgi:hypothetical protein